VQFDSLDQVNNLREIQALRRLSPHPGVIKLCEVLYDQPTRRLALVFELMDMNIYELIRGRRQYLQEQRIKNYMFQLLKSMDHMHRNGSASACAASLVARRERRATARLRARSAVQR
jgi:renal tumor antigen